MKRPPETKEIFYALEKKIVRDFILTQGKRTDGTAVRRDPAHHDRGRLSSPGPTARPSSPAARPRAWPRSPSARSRTPSGWTPSGEETKKRFMLHYNFPPFSVGEVSFLRGPGPPGDRARRPGGKGHPARRSPTTPTFPYTDPHRLRHPRIQRLLVHGHGLRRRPGPDGRRGSPEDDRRRHRHGPRHGRRSLPPS